MNTAQKNPSDDRPHEKVPPMSDPDNDPGVVSALETDPGKETEDIAPTAATSDELPAEPSLDETVAERDRYFDQWKRAQAELDNYRKRVQKENKQNLLYASISLMRDLLPGLDNLDRAIMAAESTGNANDLVEGVRMVSRQFEDILARHSATAMEAKGKPFDPNLHEAVQQIESPDHPPMTVLEVLEKGFVLRDRVVRPAKVIVSATPPEKAETSSTGDST